MLTPEVRINLKMTIRELRTQLRRLRQSSLEAHRRRPTKIPRNALCPCGSGKKYKKCCEPA